MDLNDAVDTTSSCQSESNTEEECRVTDDKGDDNASSCQKSPNTEDSNLNKAVTFDFKFNTKFIGEDGGQEWFEKSDDEETSKLHSNLYDDDSDAYSSDDDIASILDPNLSKTTQENTVRNSYLGLMNDDNFDTTFSEQREVALCSSEDETYTDSEQDLVVDISQDNEKAVESSLDMQSSNELKENIQSVVEDKKDEQVENISESSTHDNAHLKISPPKRPPPPKRPSEPSTPTPESKTNRDKHEDNSVKSSNSFNNKKDKSLPVQEAVMQSSVDKKDTKQKESKSFKQMFKGIKSSFKKQNKNDLHILDGNQKKLKNFYQVNHETKEENHANNLSPIQSKKSHLQEFGEKNKKEKDSKINVPQDKLKDVKPASPKTPPRPKAPTTFKTQSTIEKDIPKSCPDKGKEISETLTSSNAKPPKIPDQPPVGDLKQSHILTDTETPKLPKHEISSDSSSISESSPTIIVVPNKNSAGKSPPPRPPPVHKKQTTSQSTDDQQKLNQPEKSLSEANEIQMQVADKDNNVEKNQFPLDTLYNKFSTYMNSLNSKFEADHSEEVLSNIDWQSLEPFIDDSLTAFLRSWTQQHPSKGSLGSVKRESSKAWNGLIIIKGYSGKIKIEKSPSSPMMFANRRLEFLKNVSGAETNSSDYNVQSELYDQVFTLEELLNLTKHSPYKKLWVSMLSSIALLYLETLLKQDELLRFDCTPSNILCLFSQSAIDVSFMKTTKLHKNEQSIEKRCLNFRELLTCFSLKNCQDDLSIFDIAQLIYNCKSKFLTLISKQFSILPKLCLIPYLFEALQQREIFLFVLAFLMKSKD